MSFQKVMLAFYLAVAILVVLGAHWCSVHVGSQIQRQIEPQK